MSGRQRLVISARALSWWVVRSALVGSAARALSHEVAAAPRWSPLRAIAPLRAALKGEVTASRLGEIAAALEAAGTDYWIAGGWGVDALVGHQTRHHDDVDVVIGAFATRAPGACAALLQIGFELTERHQQPVWMPDQWTLEDRRGARVDLLSLDWGLLQREAPWLLDQRGVFTVGNVGGRAVPCLSAATQRLFHSGFATRCIDRHDLPLLGR